ncbi:MAG: hypothetical protein D6710_08180, partial [Nitrospirae bacterium]
MSKRAALIALVILVLLAVSCKKVKLAPQFTLVRAEHGLVSIPVDTLKDRVSFYTYRYRGRNIDFMVIRFS